MSGPGFLLFLIVPLALILAFGYLLWKGYGRSSLLGFIHSGLRDQRVVTWLNEPGSHPEWASQPTSAAPEPPSRSPPPALSVTCGATHSVPVTSTRASISSAAAPPVSPRSMPHIPAT